MFFLLLWQLKLFIHVFQRRQAVELDCWSSKQTQIMSWPLRIVHMIHWFFWFVHLKPWGIVFAKTFHIIGIVTESLVISTSNGWEWYDYMELWRNLFEVILQYLIQLFGESLPMALNQLLRKWGWQSCSNTSPPITLLSTWCAFCALEQESVLMAIP